MNDNPDDQPDFPSPYDQRDGDVQREQTETIAILPWPRGESDLHLYLAPCTDGRWHTWGENCLPGTHDAFDAIYDYADGGAYFPSREEALAEAQRWLREFTEEESKMAAEDVPLPAGLTEADVAREIGAEVAARGGTSDIMELLYCTSEEASIIEDLMRTEVFHSTLDWQSKEELAAGAREAQSIFEADRYFFRRAYAIRRLLFKKWRAESEATENPPRSAASAHGRPKNGAPNRRRRRRP